MEEKAKQALENIRKSELWYSFSKSRAVLIEDICSEDLKVIEDTLDEKEAEVNRLSKFAEIICIKGIDLLALASTKKAKTYNKISKFRYSADYTDEEYNLVKEVFNDYVNKAK